jgi:phage shock protein E
MIYLDVRTKPEFDEQHVPGAIHFELARLMKGEMPAAGINANIDIEKDTEILVYCLSGTRAGVATQILKSNGFTKAVNAGGIGNLI